MDIISPRRVKRTYRQTLNAKPADVFPLLCPVREVDWVEGWLPRLVISESGVVEPDCVFVTPDSPSDAVWYVTQHDPEFWRLEILKIVPDVTATRLQIALSGEGEKTFADVTYTHTSLGPEGDRLVAQLTAEAFETFMKKWESSLNKYLSRA